MVELEPCPFCDGVVEIERYGTPRQSTQYACTDCGCRLETGETENHGERWNEWREREKLRIAKAVAEACAERDARIAELEAQPAKATTWQPIETAPKDGTRIITNMGVRCWHVGSRKGARGFWLEKGMREWVSKLHQPTFWLPLPPLPTSEGGEG